MDYMEQALKLAGLAVGEVSPNPAVGAVIVKNDEIIGQGYTQPPGQDHAEIVALKQAGAAANGAVMYVTLEPCAHQGRTPPCTDAIITAGIKEVHFATLDDNPVVFGKGKAALVSAGIEVHVGQHREAAREINEAYFKYINTGLPFVTAKFAMSLDGKIATCTGDSKWISNDESRAYSHSLRHDADAIMAGVGTVIADDPKLTARCCAGRGGTSHKQPLRVVIDSVGRTPPEACLFGEPGRTIIAFGTQIPEDQRQSYIKAGAELVELPDGHNRVDLPALLQHLGQQQVTSILVEGGSAVLGSMFDAGLVDKVIVFIAPVIIGGAQALTPVGGIGAETLAKAWRLEKTRTSHFNGDTAITGYVLKE
ncbi:MAG: bifunctional diaminohydroxyphosphoribosylaminopyrimidine deaminase/5-amino-6-(5-phosphoribosylamino)uracil reductase RibD [Dehalogenimonas sp.]|uniref:Riboflavin biosynthesis protein RibD n=1 Tax=Candidatus Dehalogenimonas loeffleri TaxID=3127115 RepID=A0ABZ2J405_9CHLR|nr:bifunctional diaminohydroxyphosphoribosylaminopyrimidine deaminase/5-amino-6-(5-phosphoribosylamino)uracil reductase RibD [Dehalogenimonas sp.]